MWNPDAATPRAAVSNGATPRAAHTKNKTDREAYNGCCPCGHRDSPVCLCVYIDETMRGTQRPVLRGLDDFRVRVQENGGGFVVRGSLQTLVNARRCRGPAPAEG